MSLKIDWIEESKKFDQIADIYDLYRPSYPDEIIESIKTYAKIEATSNLLEIGSGTGIATDMFVKNGYSVTCVEQGANLIQVAAKKYDNLELNLHGDPRVKFVHTSFQDFEDQEAAYDMAFSAQSFHWIPKPLGYKKLANNIKDEASIHLFWNRYMTDGSEIQDELRDLLKSMRLLHMTTPKEHETFKNRTADGIEVTGLFDDLEVVEVPWERVYTYQELINFLKTSNRYVSLESKERHDLDVKLMDIFSRNHYKITMHYKCVLFNARKI